MRASANPAKGPGYLAMSTAVRDTADIVSQETGDKWSPAEVQETVWSWARTLYEIKYFSPSVN
jgi:hypothetical protein